MEKYQWYTAVVRARPAIYTAMTTYYVSTLAVGVIVVAVVVVVHYYHY